MAKFQDLTGQRFGRLTVIERAENGRCGGKAVTKWLCRCECGTEKIIEGHSLKRGRTKSCGCLNDEKREKNLKPDAGKTHGMSGTRLYKCWRGMLDRCYGNDAEHDSYKRRGISVCDEWRNGFEAFCEWAMMNGYDDSLTLDRIDNNGNYEPSNCRWATVEQQMNNMSTNHRVTCRGETYTIAEWSKISGINASTIWIRLEKGVDAETAIFSPSHKGKRLI